MSALWESFLGENSWDSLWVVDDDDVTLTLFTSLDEIADTFFWGGGGLGLALGANLPLAEKTIQ